MTKQIKSYKASELYAKLYGRKAYLEWKAREEEINVHMKDRKHYSVEDIIEMREDNFRKMKKGERFALDFSVSHAAKAA